MKQQEVYIAVSAKEFDGDEHEKYMTKGTYGKLGYDMGHIIKNLSDHFLFYFKPITAYILTEEEIEAKDREIERLKELLAIASEQVNINSNTK